MTDTPITAADPSGERLKVFWQPGCTSCLRTKEFLNKHGVSYVSIDVMADPAGFEELAALGLRTIPIVSRGKDWVNGQVIADVARIAGITLGAQTQLPPRELVGRLSTVLEVAERLMEQLPETELSTPIPGRPQTYGQLAAHLVQVAEAFADYVEHGTRLEFAAYLQDIPAGVATPADLARFGASVRERLATWWASGGSERRFAEPADVYYGEQSLHDFLERTTWHCAQHTRQLLAIVEHVGLAPAAKLTAADLRGLPIPDNVWGDDGSALLEQDRHKTSQPLGWSPAAERGGPQSARR